MRRCGAVLAGIVLAATAAGAELPRPLFYCTYDRRTDADYARGERSATAMAPDAILVAAPQVRGAWRERQFVEGKVGLARRFAAGVVYPVRGSFSPLRGTVMMWVRPTWRGDREDLYTVFFGCRDWGLVYKYKTQPYITFGWIQADGHYHYGATGSVAHWRPGRWHHLAVVYDATEAKERTLYLDGERMRTAPIPSHRRCAEGFSIGAGVGGVHPARSAIDEVALFDRPLSDAEIAEAFQRGKASKPLFPKLAAEGRRRKAIEPPSPGDRPPLPEFVDWTLPEGPPVTEWRQANRLGGRVATASRERVSLNGLWRFRPVGAEAWHYLKVPGSWPPYTGFKVRTQAGKLVTACDGIPLHKARTAWYERAFDLPAGWAEQRLVLGIDSARAVADVLLNGRPLGGLIEFERAEFDVSNAVRPGRNLLQVRVHTLNSRFAWRGIDQDVWLERRPKGPILDWADLHPLVTDKKLEVMAKPYGEAPNCTVAVRIADPDGNAVCGGRAPVEGETVRFAFPTPKLRTWHPDTPRLYVATVSLQRGGEVLDALYPIRFGYRQLEVRGGDFFLNGHRFHIRGQASPPFGRFEFNAVEAAIREWMGQMKAVHVNAVREYAGGWRSSDRSQWRELYYDIADETGLIILSHVPSNRALMHDFQRPAVARLYRRRVADNVHRYGNHACAALWFLNFNHGAHVGDIRPDLLDGSFDPVGLPEKRVHHAWMAFSEKVLRGIDGSRPVFHHAAGNYGEVLTVMAYLGFGIPLAEREEWPRAWARTRFKPLMPVETGFPCLLSNYREREGSLERVYSSEQLTPEYFAAYAGDRVYANLTEEEVRNLAAGTNRWERVEAMKRSVNYDAQKALFARWTLRSWRTWGMSGYCQHVEWRDCFRYEPVEVALAKGDPRDFGIQLDADTATIQRAAGMTRLGRVAMADNAPLLAYIAGPEKELVAKTHAWYGGETVAKSVVLVNDSPWPMTVVGTVEATLGGKALHEQEFSEPVAIGERKFLPVRFETPEVAERTEGKIALSAKIFETRLPSDTFAFECWPRPERPQETTEVALLDGAGRTAAVLEQAGVGASRELTDETRLLVIGREALDDAARKTLTDWDIEGRIAKGLNVLVFEQTGEQLAGMPMDDPNCRRAFPRAPDHPVLEGLTDADLRHWRGESDLTEPYPKTDRDDLAWGEEFTRWSNRGVVCSFAPEKPQRGAFTILVDADFDLTLAPLVEWRLGRGRVVFCQLDVTSRYGSDPVPTLLVHRLLDWLTRAPREEAGDAPRLVGPDDEPLGGVAEAEVYKVAVPPALARRGVAPSDLFWRQVRRVPVLADPARWDAHTDPPVVAVRKDGKGDVVWCGVRPDDFQDIRQVTKTMRLLAVLGETGRARPDLTASELRVGQPDSPFARRSLDFNPYRYRRW
ncbi:MAG: LamG-like jellyroll fold domain-containing protein [Planctomycetota bacterium]